MPAEYGLRTVGLVDITTRSDIFNNSGSINYYSGSRERIQPSFEYGGRLGANCVSPSTALPTKAPPSSSANCYGGLQYYFTGSYLQTNLGIENTLPTLNAIHDFSRQERGFAYLSTFLDPYTRLSLIAGTHTANFQIPNTPNQPTTLNSAFGVTNFNSANLNERQNEQSQFAVLALQRSVNGFDGLLFHTLQQPTLYSGPRWRSPHQRGRLGCQPAVLYQRLRRRRGLCHRAPAHIARRFHGERRTDLGR